MKSFTALNKHHLRPFQFYASDHHPCKSLWCSEGGWIYRIDQLSVDVLYSVRQSAQLMWRNHPDIRKFLAYVDSQLLCYVGVRARLASWVNQSVDNHRTWLGYIQNCLDDLHLTSTKEPDAEFERLKKIFAELHRYVGCLSTKALNTVDEAQDSPITVCSTGSVYLKTVLIDKNFVLTDELLAITLAPTAIPFLKDLATVLGLGRMSIPAMPVFYSSQSSR